MTLYDEYPVITLYDEYPVLRAIKLLSECVKYGVCPSDPNEPGTILVWRKEGTPSEEYPEGWYSENILDIAGELVDAPEEMDFLQRQVDIAVWRRRFDKE